MRVCCLASNDCQIDGILLKGSDGRLPMKWGGLIDDIIQLTKVNKSISAYDDSVANDQWPEMWIS